MKHISRATLLVGTIIWMTHVFGQVQVTLAIPNLGSPYLSDYISRETNRVLILTNTTGQRQEIFLRGKIEQLSSPGFYFRTKEAYRPSTALTLNAFETKTLFATAEDWAFIEEDQLEDNVPDEQKRLIERTGILPEGEYQICVQAFDIVTGAALSPDEPVGCQFFIITLGTPPQIVLPATEDTIDLEYPMISWTPAISMHALADIRYDLYIVEHVSRALNPYEVMEQSILYRGGNPFVVEDLMQTSYQMLPGDPPFVQGRQYILCVVARTSRGSFQFENEGRSEIVIVNTNNGQNGIAGFYPGDGITSTSVNPDLFQLYPLSHLKGKLFYRFYEDVGEAIAEYTDVSSAELEIMAIGSNPMLQNQGFQPVQEALQQQSNSNGQANGGSPGGSMQLGGVGNNQQAVFGNNIIVPFPPPQYVLPSGYNTIAGKALKKARIRFTARYAIGKKQMIEHPEDLQLIVGFGSEMQVTGSLVPGTLSIPAATKVLGVTTTDADGNYDVSFLADETFGVLAEGPVQVQVGVGDIPMTEKGFGLYRVITMEVEEKWYCHPDIVIFLQPGQSLDLPDQVVTVQSYNAQFTIMGTMYWKQAAENAPIDNAVVKIGRSKNDYEQAPDCFPKDEIRIDQFKPLLFHFNDMLADSGVTGANGLVTFKRLVKHDGYGGCGDLYGSNYPTDGYYVEAFSHPLIGDLNYGSGWISSFNPCEGRLPYSCDANECAPRSAGYVPPLVLDTIRLVPLFPRIDVHTRAGFGSFPALPDVSLVLVADHPDGTIGVEAYKSDVNGHFRRQLSSTDVPKLLYYISTGEKAGEIPYSYHMYMYKYGYDLMPCANCGPDKPQTLSFGHRWIMKPLFKPDSYVQGKVIDEYGQALSGKVKIGDGPWISFEPEWPEYMFDPNQAMQLQGQQNGQSGQVLGNEGVAIEGMVIDNFDFGGMNVQYDGIAIQPGMLQMSRFDCPAASGNHVQVIIDPDASNYFQDTFYVDIPSGHTPPGYDIGVFKIKQTLHRPQIIVYQKVVSADNNAWINLVNAPLEGAEVKFSDFPAKITGPDGAVKFAPFGSPSVEFHLQVSKDGFAPYDQYVKDSVSKETHIIEVVLENGKTIIGTVSNAKTGLPIQNARISATIGYNEYGPITLETYSNKNGQYSLQNLPSDYISITATKAADDVTYIGLTKEVNTAQVSELNFQLTEAPFLLSEIWNLPVELETVIPQGNKWKITGSFLDIPENTRFKVEDPTVRLPFKNVIVKANGTGPNGKPLVEPEATSILTDALKIRAVLNNAHAIEMSGPLGSGHQMHSYNPAFEPVAIHEIRVDKEGGNGHVKVRAYSLLEYFNFSYEYTGQFYLGESTESITLSGFKGDAETSMPETYYLMDYDESSQQIINPSYTVHEFEAFADRNESYVKEDSFVIATKLVVDLPLSNPEELIIHTGDVIILPDKVVVNSGDQPLEFDLETWHVETNAWAFDPSKGGIVTSGVIHTQLLSVEADEILIKPDNLSFPPVDQIDLDEITLGGFIPLDIDEANAKLYFDYVEQPAHSSTGHWRIALTNEQEGQSVAAVKGLPGWGQAEVNFYFLEAFSDGFKELGLAPNQVVNHFNVISQSMSNVLILSDGLKFVGNVDLGIPNLSTGNEVGFVYFQEQNQTQVRLQGLSTTFETTGQVEFIGDEVYDRIHLSQNHFDVTGFVKIYDDLSSHEITLRGKLIKEPNNIRIKIIHVDGNGDLEGNIEQTIALGGGQSGLKKVLQGEQLVEGQNWQSLVYQARFEGFGNGFQDGHDIMWFRVDGAITNDEGQGDQIKLTNIETPFGDFSLTLDFNEMAIVGDLRVANIPMGAVTILEGVINMKMGGLGFYLTAHLRALYPLIAELNTNFIVGSYPSLSADAQQVLKTGMYIQQLPGFLTQSGIQGLYICANKPLFQMDWEVDLLVFGVGVYANAGIDARFWLNFGETYGGAYLGGLAYADFEIYVNVLICEFCAGVMAELGFQAEYQWEPSTEFSISACGTVGLNASICGYDMGETVKLSLGWSSESSDIDLDAELGSTCSGNANQQDGGCKHF